MKAFDSYKYTVQARNFHYDNFSKWMTYYYVAVAAVFVAYYSYNSNDIISTLIVTLGCFISILWHLSCKGYYFWIKNWTDLINRLEYQNKNEFEKVYSIFSKQVKENNNVLINPIQSANISTSKVTLILSFGISIFWFFLLVDKLITKYFGINVYYSLVFLIAVFLSSLVIFIFGKFLKSDISKHKLVDCEIDN
jgi:hypothetical protein